ncbi:hypothetical protein [Salinicola peritrichatus]|uniref:hypothetical protein n=1 Tax=Salinicola peritrichatus TaxID=1267424 RepID=UPI000DA2234A|nr:hypothetical protein [Salinicola peritrichatus]
MNPMRQRQIFTEAMQFAIGDDEPATFLRLWLEGEWEALEKEWPDYSIPGELKKAVNRYWDLVRADRQVVMYAYQYDLDGPGCVALQPVRDAAPIVLEPSEVETFLAIIAGDEPLEGLLLENCQDDLVEEADDGEILVSAEIPLLELRSRTFYWQHTDASPLEAQLLKRIHLASAPWQARGADMVQIVGYSR